MYLLRIEDTDQARFEERARSRQFETGFDYFGIRPRTSRTWPAARPTGLYTQSARAAICETYVRELMRQGKAYPCFETPEQAEARAAAAEGDSCALPGYYGDWAIWRDAPRGPGCAPGWPLVTRTSSGSGPPASAARGSASPT